MVGINLALKRGAKRNSPNKRTKIIIPVPSARFNSGNIFANCVKNCSIFCFLIPFLKLSYKPKPLSMYITKNLITFKNTKATIGDKSSIPTGGITFLNGSR